MHTASSVYNVYYTWENKHTNIVHIFPEV